jgi:bifunctional non-homologous end joining protein LigD
VFDKSPAPGARLARYVELGKQEVLSVTLRRQLKAKRQPSRTPAGRKKTINLSNAPKAAMPRSVKPMLATPEAEPFDDPNWIFEIKWDGYRTLAEVDKSGVRLYSRNNLPLEKRFAPIVTSLRQFGHEAVLDGEAVILDAEGRPQFQLLQNRGGSKQGTLVYEVFDLLYLDGHDLRGLPLRRRKQILSEILDLPNVRVSEHIAQHGRAFYQVVAQQGLEGIVAKDGRSKYVTGRRSNSWYKIKATRRQLAVIGGFTDQRGNPRVIGSLILGAHRGDDLVYIGNVGTGFTDQAFVDLRRTFEPLIQAVCPFRNKPKMGAPVHWLRSALVCEIAYTARTSGCHLRHPVFMGLREGAKPSEAKWEPT